MCEVKRGTGRLGGGGVLSESVADMEKECWWMYEVDAEKTTVTKMEDGDAEW